MSDATQPGQIKPVALIGTLDTKGAEIAYLRDQLTRAGVASLVLDIGVLGAVTGHADVKRDEIARLGGSSIDELTMQADRGRAVAVMQAGMTAWMKQNGAARISGALAIGGSAGTAIASAGMRELPIGMPKLLVSTMASGEVRPYVGTSDITMMYSVGDFTGLNRLTRAILGNAAGAIVGMCGVSHGDAVETAPLIGATMFGVTTPCVRQVQELLERQGYELLVFHATGTGGMAMERLIKEGFIQGVADITTTELADELVGGVLSAGPHRLEAAVDAGLPQVVSLGALDMVNFGPPETVPAKFKGRLFYQHNSAVTLMRTTPDENEALGKVIAQKLSRGRAPVKLLMPLRGVSAIDCEGRPFFDPEADRRLFAAIRENVGSQVELIELDMNINDIRFSERFASEFVAAMHVARGRTELQPKQQEISNVS